MECFNFKSAGACHAGCKAYKTRLAYSYTDVCKEATREAYESNPEKKKEAARKAYNANSKYK